MAISLNSQRFLWARSGGFCQNPACNSDFFVIFADGKVTSTAELSHVIGRSKRGPRGDNELSAEERDECENIILLCPTCHTLVDKNPRQFPAETLCEWKRSHEHVIRRQFEVAVYVSREKLAPVVHKLLRLNRGIFLQYGPHSEHSKKPYSDAAAVWQRCVLGACAIGCFCWAPRGFAGNETSDGLLRSATRGHRPAGGRRMPVDGPADRADWGRIALLHAAASPCIRFMFSARHTRAHSPCAWFKPRTLKRRKPSACLIQPLGASDSHLRLAYCA